MPSPICIAVDAMGGDHSPAVNVRGSLRALEREPSLRIALAGPKPVLEAELARYGAKRSDRIVIHDADDIISMDDPAVQAARQKQDSSMHVAMRLVKEGTADAFLSAGNSGAVMTVALFELGRLKNVERPAIVVKLPTVDGWVVLLDVGANVDCRPEHLVQFARMGAVFCTTIEGLPSPRIGLLSNGSEPHKGCELTRATHALLLNTPHLNYLGNVEGSDLFRGGVDVVVCDGFVGNVALKVSEGLAEASFLWFKNQLGKSLLGIAGSLLIKETLKRFRKKFDSEPYGAAPLLGIEGLVLISHGSASELAISNGIQTAVRGVQQRFLERMKEALSP